MNNSDNIENKPDTVESVLLLIREMAESFKRERAESDARFEKRSAEFDAKFEKRSAESDAKFEKRSAESDAKFEKRSAEFDREMAASRADYDRRQKNMEKIIGAWSNNHGEFAEEYFFNSFEAGKRDFFGEKFDSIKKNLKGIENDDEYDIVIINGKSVCIVEIKFKAHHDHIPKVIGKAQTFRENFPNFAGHRVYLAIASLNFTSDVEEDFKNNGIAVIKQSGDTVVIYDDNLKAY